jgi:probable non-F420 flavinoid oxidoreductase
VAGVTVVGYHASHEQLAPSALLAAVRDAEAAGFGAAMCSDHLAPWSTRQGHSGHAWAWLGSALQATALGFGVVSAPGQRYHPAVLAQAIATLGELHPGRLWVALGSGQLLNEHVTADRWPPRDVRTARLAECAAVMRALLAGEEVSHDGLIRVDRARLWSLPAEPPRLLGAAVTPPTAGRVAAWADGLITVNQSGDAHAETLRAYREAGGRGPAVLQAHLSWDPDPDRALALAHDQWREAALGSPVGWELATPAELEAAARFARPEDTAAAVHVSADLGAHADWLARQAAHGFEAVMVHHVGQEQRPFIEAFGEHVLPRLRP